MRAPVRQPGAGLGAGSPVDVTGRLGGGAVVALTAPYNQLFIMGPGDSRTAQGGGLSGTYGSGNGVSDSIDQSTGGIYNGTIPIYAGHRIRENNNLVNMGMGGQTAAQALSYPRVVTLSACTGRIDNGTAGNAGNVLTISAKSGGDNLGVGQRVTITGGTACTITALGTGVGGTGTYTVDGAAQNVASTATVQPYYVYGGAGAKDIATAAANQAAIIFLWLGTNSAGSAGDLAAIDTAIRGLTDPTYSYPGYGGPLPLYGGLPKTIVLMNDTRRGITTANGVNQQNTAPNALQFTTFARTLKRYSFDSGDTTYANPHVIVCDTYDDPVLANLADTTTYNPNAGYFGDGLHPAWPAVLQVGKIGGARLAAALPVSFTSLAHLLDTTTQAAQSLIQNPLFTTTTGGTQSIGSNTLTGTIPGNWQLVASAGSGLTIDLSYNALGGVLGNELVIHITGTASANMTVTLNGTGSSAQRATFNLATEKARLAYRASLTIAAGSVYSAALIYGVQAGSAANQMGGRMPASGGSLGYGNNAAYPIFLKNAYASGEFSTLTFSGKSIDMSPYTTGTPSATTIAVSLSVLAGAVDMTFALSQVSLMKVTD